METCQLCGVTEIARNTFNKLDSMADGDDMIICRDCFKGRLHEAVITTKAETKTALLVRIDWIRQED